MKHLLGQLRSSPQSGWASGSFRRAGAGAALSAVGLHAEAERRGYTTLATRNFQQYKDGWSLDLQARDRAGRVSWDRASWRHAPVT